MTTMTEKSARLPQIADWSVVVKHGPDGKYRVYTGDGTNPHLLEGRELECYRAGFVLKPHRDSWYVVQQRAFPPAGPFPVAGPFSSREEALNAIPEVQEDEVRLKKAPGLVRSFEGGGWYFVDHQRQRVAGPFTCWADLANAIDGIVQKREAREEEYRRFVEDERMKKAKIPEAYRGIALDDLKLSPEVRETVDAFVEGFRWRGQSLVVCGGGNTRLGCAIAETLARAGHDTRYATASDAILTQHGSPELQSELRASSVVLDWSGFKSDVETALAAQSLAALLRALAEESRTVLLLAECSLADLERYLGKRAFEELRARTWKFVNSEGI